MRALACEYAICAVARVRTNHVRYNDTVVVEQESGEYVWCVGIDEKDLPDGVKRTGLTIRSEREVAEAFQSVF